MHRTERSIGPPADRRRGSSGWAGSRRSVAVAVPGPASGPTALPFPAAQGKRRGTADGFLLVLGDGLAFVCAALGGLWAWSSAAGQPFDLAWVIGRAAWFSLIVPWLFLLLPARRPGIAMSGRATAVVVLQAVAIGAAVYTAAYFLAPRDLLPRFGVLVGFGLVFPMTIAWRMVYLRFVTHASRRRPVAVVGTGAAAREIARVLKTTSPDRTVVAFVGESDADIRRRDAADCVDAAGLRRLVVERRVEEIVLAPTAPLGTDQIRAIVYAQYRDVDMMTMQAVYEQMLLRTPVRYLETDQVFAAPVASAFFRNLNRMAKRAFDVAIGCAGCAALLLFLPVLGPLVRLGVGRPILYRQRRVGRAGREFEIVKFRTMRPGAERNGPQWARTNDPRATPVGRFLRLSRIDETPQFWNMLRGDMSLIGPRPERPEFVEQLEREIPFYRERLAVRPGVSGWAQVNHSYGGSVEDAHVKLEYDLYYVKHQNLLFDLLIALRTFWTVVAFGGR